MIGPAGFMAAPKDAPKEHSNIPPTAKCKHCGKEKWNHLAKTEECPHGPKSRTMGYLSYGPAVFELRLAKVKSGIKST